MGPLTLWVLEAAMQQWQAWRQADLALDVAVNLSMTNLRDPLLSERITALLAAYEMPPTALWLELTESTVMADAARTLESLTRLASLGVQNSIDDFGTGYSSLAYLQRLPITELKIDRSFVQHMTTRATDRAIVASTISLGHMLALRVLAEGVESRETWDLLAAMRCDAAQGYYPTRPLPVAAFTHWLHEAPWPVGPC